MRTMNLASRNWYIIGLLILVGFGCSENEGETERSKTIRLLTNDASKKWEVSQIFIDEVEQQITGCDMSYTLTLNADFSWKEIYLNISCYQIHEGSWSLNDESSVISIQFVDNASGKNVEKHFEIVELSEGIFSYQYPENNEMKKIRLTASVD